MRIFFSLLVITVIFSRSVCLAQTIDITSEMRENVKLYNEKIDELIAKHTLNGFKLFQESKLPLRSDIEMVLHLPLVAGNWYHFCFVGDPGSTKIKATLFLEGYGDLIQDRINVRKMNEFWTEFSLQCPQSGDYELTLYQKSDIPRPLSYLTIFKKMNEGL